MNKTIKGVLGVGLLSAGTCGVLAQSISASAVATEEVQFYPPKTGQPKRPVQVYASPEVRAFAFSGNSFANDAAKQPLILQGEKQSVKSADELREDMAVMALILEKICAEHGGDSERVLGLDILAHAGRAARNLYIDDYGVIFTLNVGVPLKPSNSEEDIEGKQEKQVNREWEAARRELFGGQTPGAVFLLENRESRKFDQGAVKRLTANLVNALTNAANIRNLNDEHWVVFAVRGPGAEARLWDTETGRPSSAAPSTLLIKARRADINALSEGSMAQEEFRKKLTVSVY